MYKTFINLVTEQRWGEEEVTGLWKLVTTTYQMDPTLDPLVLTTTTEPETGGVGNV